MLINENSHMILDRKKRKKKITWAWNLFFLFTYIRSSSSGIGESPGNSGPVIVKVK